MRASLELLRGATVAAFLVHFVDAAADAKQIALVIGNGHYEHMVGVETALADAAAY